MTKRIPAPFSFIVAVVLTLALFIFFGAWAVSTDAEGRDRTFAFAIGGPGTALLAQEDGNSAPAFGQGENSLGQENSNAETWWGKSLLKT